MQEDTCRMASGIGWSFEVTGKVQGVFFRKYTIRKAQQLGLAGWVRNTHRGTVEGQVAGRTQALLDEMKDWLQYTGSPASRIDGAHFAALTAQQVEFMDLASRALLRGQDLTQPVVRIVNHSEQDALQVFWQHAETKQEVAVQGNVAPGATFETNTFPGHVFVVYNARGERREFTVTAPYGQEQEWTWNDDDEEEEEEL